MLLAVKMIVNNWRKSSSSAAGNCVEAGSNWRKSTYSDLHSLDGNATCVEAGKVEQLVALRDTKDRGRGMITMSRSSFSRLLTKLKD
jgi:hypothetical protein